MVGAGNKRGGPSCNSVRLGRIAHEHEQCERNPDPR